MGETIRGGCGISGGVNCGLLCGITSSLGLSAEVGFKLLGDTGSGVLSWESVDIVGVHYQRWERTRVCLIVNRTNFR